MNKNSNKKSQRKLKSTDNNYYAIGDYLSDPGLMRGQSIVPGGIDMGKINAQGVSTLKSAGQAESAAGGFSAGQAMAGINGAMGLIDSTMSSFDTSGIGSEVRQTSDISRDDIMSTDISVDSKKKGVGQIGSESASAAMAGMQVAGPWGALAGLVPIATGIFGNKAKERKARAAEEQWQQNIDAKDRQFNWQDTRTSLANFAAEGGQFNMQNDESGLTEFNAGGSHEQNPNGGVMQGTGANGKPNLVEQGETKHKDYIFSDRLVIDDELIAANKLPSYISGKTFAQASKILNKEAKERPNDPISKNATKANMAKLTQAQEAKKKLMNLQQGQDANILAEGFARGGKLKSNGVDLFMNNPYALGGDIDSTSNLNEFVIKADAPKVVYDTIPNRIRYNNSGKKLFSTEDQIPALFKSEYDKYKSMNTSDDVINRILKDKYKIEKLGPTMVPTDKSKKLIDSNVKRYGTIETPNTFASGGGFDYARYAPLAANTALGLSDMFEKPEVVKYGRVSPENITSRMDYQPIDTEWMANKIKGQSAGLRDDIINSSGGNRAIAMAGLSGVNRQSQEALGEQYMRSADVNYGRKNQALQFNAGIEAQNVAARNAAQAQNLQLQMQEDDMNARARAAKRAAARNAIIQAAQGLGEIGRENWAVKSGIAMYGYGKDKNGNYSYKEK